MGRCEEPTDQLSPMQFVSAGVKDGRRLYVHEGSFHHLAAQCRDAAALIFAGLIALPAVKLVHHDLVEEGVGVYGFDPAKAEALKRAIGLRWFGAITATLKCVGVRRRSGGGEVMSPLIEDDEQIVATCLDAGYYTFATTEPAAARMYADVLKLRLVRAYVREGGDAYRDLSMIRGPRLELVEVRSGRGEFRAKELEEVKVATLQQFQTELACIIEESVPQPSVVERDRLEEFKQRCLTTVRTTVLHLK